MEKTIVPVPTEKLQITKIDDPNKIQPAGYHGAYIDPISENKGEEEYLLKNDTKLITTKIQKVKTHTISTMKFVKTSSKGKIISQKNKKHSSNGAYWLITLNLEN